MNSASFVNSTIAENVLKEARNIAKKFGDFGDMSFEDLNNISQHLIDASGDMSIIDTDLQDMKVNIPNDHREQHSTSSPNKTKLNEQLMRIKKEVDAEDTEQTEDIDELKNEPTTDGTDVEALWLNLKSVINEGNKEEAKKHLLRLNEALGKNTQQPEKKNTMEVQPIIRQATFEIDPVTGQRKEGIKEPVQPVVNDDLLRQLAALLSGHVAGVQAVDLVAKDAPVGRMAVVIVPTPAATPTKSQRPVLPASSRPQSAIKPPLDKKLSTPLKRLTQANRRVSFTNPRPIPARAQPNEHKPLERAGLVRKSLMPPAEKSPQVSKAKVGATSSVKPVPRPSASAAPRRSSSLKIPDVHLTKPSPMKTAAPRPSTGAPYNKRLSQLPATSSRVPATSRLAPIGRSRTMSEQKKPVSEFKAPSVVRKAASKADSLV